MKGFVLGAEKSGSGKTTITTGIIKALSNRNKKIAPFKCGPDYIDTRHLSRSAGHPAENLDSVMLDNETLETIFAEGCKGRDIAVVEGVMGFFDGIDHENFHGSTYDVASRIGLPAVIVLNAASSSFTIAAFLKGIQLLSKDVEIAGIILNNIASANHEKLIKDAIKNHVGLPIFGSVPKFNEPLLASRYLGLETDLEVEEKYYSECANLAENHIDLDALSALNISKQMKETSNDYPKSSKICAVALDKAFSFYYEANIRKLRKLGYDIKFFSPLNDETVNDADFIYIGGGYPELYTEKLSANKNLFEWLREHQSNKKHMLGECGGMMLLSKGVYVGDKFKDMAGIFDTKVRMTEKRQALGYLSIVEHHALDGLIGHEFRYSKPEDVNEKYIFDLKKLTTKTNFLDGFKKDNALACYVHFHFCSKPSLLDFIFR